jgi:hypothetical protein
VLALTDSPDLVDVPAIDSSQSVVVTPASSAPYHSWQQLLDDPPNADALDFLIAPGDYRRLGALTLLNRPGGTQARPKTVRYHHPPTDSVHPVKRAKCAQVSSLLFAGPMTTSWLVRGLTISRPTDEDAYPVVIAGKASRITVDHCLVEFGLVYHVRIRDSEDCTVQRCVIREAMNGPCNHADSVGIQVKPAAKHALGVRLLDNEIYNVGDGIQLTPAADRWLPVEVTIEGNDIYLEPSRYVGVKGTTWDENAIDIKTGSDRAASTIVRNNRMWGMRRNEGGTAQGEVIVVQRECRNALFEDNIIGDAPRGMKDENWKDDSGIPVNTPRDVVFRRNQFYLIRDIADADRGAITRPITSGISFLDNYFARSAFVADQTPPAYRDGGPSYRGNILSRVTDVQRLESRDPAVPLDPAVNPTVSAPHGYERYQRQRWTGPRIATGAIPLAEPEGPRTHRPQHPRTERP